MTCNLNLPPATCNLPLSQSSIVIDRSLNQSGLLVLRRVLDALDLRVNVDRYAVALAVISLLALGPMLQAGYFWGAHDARHSVYFLFEFDRVFQDGIWYPRWFPDMTYGYGYPLFNIYGPLAFYVGEFFHLLGTDFVLSAKIVFALAWVLSGLAMYGFVKRVFSNEAPTTGEPFENHAAAFVAGLAYVFMLYHLIDVYVRAALAESVALVFLPLTLWAFYDTVKVRSLRSVLFAALSYAGMVFAHNGIALLFSIVLGAWIVFLLLRDSEISETRVSAPKNGAAKTWFLDLIRRGLPTAGALALGLGLTGIFMLPLIAEYRFINVAEWTQNYYNYQEHFVEFYQLFSPLWGFGISQNGPVDGLSFQLGAVPLILALFSLIAIARNPGKLRGILVFFLGMTLVVVILMFSFSLPVWRTFGLAGVAQFPWRLLTLTTLSLSVLAGAVLLHDGGPRTEDERTTNDAGRTTKEEHPSLVTPLPSTVVRRPSAFDLPMLALSALILLGSYPYITSQNIVEPREGAVGLTGLMRFEQSANEMTGTTVYANEQPRWSSLADLMVTRRTIRSKIDFSTVPDWLFIRIPRDEMRTTGERVDYNAPNGDAPIVFNVQMYPGWRAYLTASRSTNILRELPIEIEPPYGRIKVTLPQGEHGFWLRFEDTLPRIVGTITSVVAVIIVAGLFVWDVRKRLETRD